MNFSRSGSRGALACSAETKHAQLSTGNSLLSDETPTEQRGPGLLPPGANKARLARTRATSRGASHFACFVSFFFLRVKDVVFAKFLSVVFNPDGAEGRNFVQL